MLSTSWSICGIDTDGHDLTLSRLVAWGEAGELVPTSVASALTPIAGTVDNLLEDDATTVTFAAADVRQPGFLITFEFAEPVELWGWRMAALTRAGWPRMHAVRAGEHVQFLGQLEWQGIGELSAPSYSPVNFAQACGAFVSLPAAGSRSWRVVATHDGVTVYAAVYGGVIYKSTDGGATWVALSSGGSRSWYGVATHDGLTVYAAVYGGVIYKSADGGATWAALSSGSRTWCGVATHDGVTVYAVVWGGLIYKSADGGATWAALSSGSRSWWGVATHDGVTVYAVVYGGVIYKSADGGATWVALSSGSRYWQGVATHDGVTVYAAVYGGVIYKSADGGATWAALSSGSRNWYGVATHDGVTLYAVESGGAIYKNISLLSIYNIDLRALTTSTPVTAGAPPLEDATLAVEPVYTTIDLDVGGCGRIYGTVKRKADPQNIPLVRRVRLHDSRTGALLRQTWSQEDGSYEFRDLNPDLEFDVIAWDHEGQFRSTIANNLKPEVLP